MNENFLMLPKEIMTRKLSDGGKLLYAFMLDRSKLSLQNGWQDSEGNVYIYFSLKEINAKLGWSERKAIKVFAELENEGLITRRKQGMGKPAIIYVKDLQCEEAPAKMQDKNFQNDKSGACKTSGHNLHKMQSNNTDNNNTDKSYTYGQSNPGGGTDWMVRRQSFKELIKENICYKVCCVRHGAVWCDEIVEIMTDTVMSGKPYIKINGEDYPAEAVKSRFLKINDMHIQYINDSLAATNTPIRNIRQFLITAIYRAPETMDNWYAARVNAAQI